MRQVNLVLRSQTTADHPLQVVFIDVMDSIIEQLQKTPSYTVTEIGTEGTKVNTITNYRAINSKYNEKDVIKEISEADIVISKPLLKSLSDSIYR